MYTTIIKLIDSNNKVLESITISEKLNIDIHLNDIVSYKLGKLKSINGIVVKREIDIDDDAEYFKNIDITETITLATRWSKFKTN